MGNTIELSDEFIVKKAAVILKDAVLQTIDSSPDIPRPPTVNSLQTREPPDILNTHFVNPFDPSLDSDKNCQHIELFA